MNLKKTDYLDYLDGILTMEQITVLKKFLPGKVRSNNTIHFDSLDSILTREQSTALKKFLSGKLKLNRGYDLQSKKVANLHLYGLRCDLYLAEDFNESDYSTKIKVKNFHEKSGNYGAALYRSLGEAPVKTPKTKHMAPTIKYLQIPPRKSYHTIDLNFHGGNRCIPYHEALNVTADLAILARSNLFELYECDVCSSSKIERIVLYKK